MVYVSGLNYESIVDGDGVRTAIYFSGCKWDCLGCHNPSTHSFTNGQPFTEDTQHAIMEHLKCATYVRGITLSGGDPLFNAKEISQFVKDLKSEVPYINIWIYTGFTFDVAIQDEDRLELIKLCDVMVDGKFEIDKRDITLAYRGSSNQRIISIQESLQKGEVVLYDKSRVN